MRSSPTNCALPWLSCLTCGSRRAGKECRAFPLFVELDEHPTVIFCPIRVLPGVVVIRTFELQTPSSPATRRRHQRPPAGLVFRSVSRACSVYIKVFKQRLLLHLGSVGLLAAIAILRAAALRNSRTREVPPTIAVLASVVSAALVVRVTQPFKSTGRHRNHSAPPHNRLRHEAPRQIGQLQVSAARRRLPAKPPWWAFAQGVGHAETPARPGTPPLECGQKTSAPLPSLVPNTVARFRGFSAPEWGWVRMTLQSRAPRVFSSSFCASAGRTQSSVTSSETRRARQITPFAVSGPHLRRHPPHATPPLCRAQPDRRASSPTPDCRCKWGHATLTVRSRIDEFIARRGPAAWMQPSNPATIVFSSFFFMSGLLNACGKLPEDRTARKMVQKALKCPDKLRSE